MALRAVRARVICASKNAALASELFFMTGWQRSDNEPPPSWTESERLVLARRATLSRTRHMICRDLLPAEAKAIVNLYDLS